MKVAQKFMKCSVASLALMIANPSEPVQVSNALKLNRKVNKKRRGVDGCLVGIGAVGGVVAAMFGALACYADHGNSTESEPVTSPEEAYVPPVDQNRSNHEKNITKITAGLMSAVLMRRLGNITEANALAEKQKQLLCEKEKASVEAAEGIVSNAHIDGTEEVIAATKTFMIGVFKEAIYNIETEDERNLMADMLKNPDRSGEEVAKHVMTLGTTHCSASLTTNGLGHVSLSITTIKTRYAEAAAVEWLDKLSDKYQHYPRHFERQIQRFITSFLDAFSLKPRAARARAAVPSKADPRAPMAMTRD